MGLGGCLGGVSGVLCLFTLTLGAAYYLGWFGGSYWFFIAAGLWFWFGCFIVRRRRAYFYTCYEGSKKIERRVDRYCAGLVFTRS
jgi:hypothetical protein